MKGFLQGQGSPPWQLHGEQVGMGKVEAKSYGPEPDRVLQPGPGQGSGGAEVLQGMNWRGVLEGESALRMRVQGDHSPTPCSRTEDLVCFGPQSIILLS